MKKWDNVFKSGLSKFCERQSLKNFKGYGRLSRPYLMKFFKDCLPQNLLSPLLNTVPYKTSMKAWKITSLCKSFNFWRNSNSSLEVNNIIFKLLTISEANSKSFFSCCKISARAQYIFWALRRKHKCLDKINIEICNE